MVTGIVMECNPFHEGHQYILNKAREIAGDGHVIVILSGDYVQRGIPAIMSKEQRTHTVLAAGADLVLELPLPYATGAANYFATGAMNLLLRLGVVTDLVFGSLSADADAIIRAAALLDAEPPEFQECLRAALSEGLSYPAARARAAANALGISLPTNGNDVLGIEYVRALNHYTPEHSIRIHAIPRIDTDSATLRRTRMLDAMSQGLTDHETYYMRANAFSQMLHYRLLSLTGLSGSADAAAALMQYQDVDHDLACRIVRLLPDYHTWEDYCMQLKTRNVTYTRVSRALLHILLDIRADDVAALTAAGTIGYARILGFRRSAGSLLATLREQSTIPLITSPSEGLRSEDIPPVFRQQLRRDLTASELYDAVLQHGRAGIEPSRICERSKPMIII